MNKILIATVGGLVALVCWGISDWLAAKSSKKFAGRDVNLALQLSGAIIMLVVWLISGQPIPNIEAILILMGAGIFFTLAYLLFIKGLSMSDAGIVVPLGNIYPMVTLLLTFIFLTLSFSALQVGAMVVIMVGSVLLGVEKLNRRKLHKSLSIEALYALGAALLWGIGFFLVNIEVPKLEWVQILAVDSIAMGIITFMMSAFQDRRPNFKVVKNIFANQTGIIAGCLLTLGSIGFYISAQKSKSLLVPAVIASGAPLMTAILAAVFDKERINSIKKVGVLVVVLGLVLLNF